MSITAALVLFSVTWFIVLFCVLAIRFESQAEAGEAVAGTPKSAAPANFSFKRKARITTLVTAVLFALLYLIITSGWITIDNMDIFGVMDRVPKAGG
jgi:predicted secreted protein